MTATNYGIVGGQVRKEFFDSIFGGTVSIADALATDDGWDWAGRFLYGYGGSGVPYDDVKVCRTLSKLAKWFNK